MDKEKAESIICNAVIEIHKILFNTTFAALITTPRPKKTREDVLWLPLLLLTW
jgi:hypothetical protein